MEPAGSPVLSEGRAGAHKIQGIGAGFVPETLDTAIYDEVIAIEDEEAFEAGRELAAHDGLLVGISSARPWRRRRSWRADPKTWARTSSSSCPTRASATFPPPCSISRKPSTFLFRYKFVGSSTASGALGNGRGSIRKAPFRPTEESSTWQPRRPPYFPL